MCYEPNPKAKHCDFIIQQIGVVVAAAAAAVVFVVYFVLIKKTKVVNFL